MDPERGTAGRARREPESARREARAPRARGARRALLRSAIGVDADGATRAAASEIARAARERGLAVDERPSAREALAAPGLAARAQFCVPLDVVTSSTSHVLSSRRPSQGSLAGVRKSSAYTRV